MFSKNRHKFCQLCYGFIFFLLSLQIYSRKEVQISSFPSDSAYSSLTNLGSYTFGSSSKSVNVYLGQDQLALLTSSTYHRATENQTNLIGFYYIGEQRLFQMDDDIGFYAHLLSSITQIKVKFSNDTCRLPFAFTATDKVQFIMLDGVLSASFQGVTTSLSSYFNSNKNFAQNELISIGFPASETPKFLYIICPFFEDASTSFEIEVEFTNEKDLVLGGNLAQSLIDLMENDTSVTKDNDITDQLKDKSPIEEDIELQKYGAGLVIFKSSEDFTIESDKEVHHTVLLRLKSNQFQFVEPRKLDQFDLTVKFEDDKRDLVDSLYFLFENDTKETQQIQLILGESQAVRLERINWEKIRESIWSTSSSESPCSWSSF